MVFYIQDAKNLIINKQFILFMFLLFNLTGCARMLALETPYDKARWYDGVGGYEDEKISDGIYKIKFTGNAITASEKILSYWHRRATELCNGNYESDPELVQRDLAMIPMPNGLFIYTDLKKTIVSGVAKCKK